MKKTTILVTALLASGLLSIQAQYQVVEHGANYRVLQKTAVENGTNRVHRYTELSTGMYYTNSNGQLTESKEIIETYPKGAIARQGPYQVIFANNLNSAGAIDLQTPDGKRLRSSILGLAYYDSSTSNNVMIAQIQDSQGELISSNQVLYPDVFKGVKADVRYTYKKGSFEQDVILLEQPPAPESFGLNPQTTEIEVLTEFINPPQAKIAEHKLKNNSLPDDDVDWGVTKIGHGRAFDLGESRNSHSQVTVRRQYVTAQNRNILVEGVSIQTIKSSLANLPLQARSASKLPAVVSKTLVLPQTPLARAEQKPMRLASASPTDKGFVLDYVELDSGRTNFTFQNGATYFVNGAFYLSGTTTFEGGAVVKFSDGTIYLDEDSTLICNTAPENPAFLTSGNDDSVGNVIDGSSGNPNLSDDCCFLNLGCPSIVLSNICFYYGMSSIEANHADLDLWNCQFLPVDIAVDNADNVSLHNVLLQEVWTDDPISYTGYAFAENVTYDCVSPFYLYYWYLGVNDARNCLFVFEGMDPQGGSVVPGGNVSVSTSENGFVYSADSVFQTAGNANYYLAANSPYRGAGTPVLGELTTMTTYAPQDGSWPDTNATDLGYHYPVNEDSDHDGLPDWWEWKWFGNYTHSGSELDPLGNTLFYDFTNNVDLSIPVQFSIEATNNYVKTSFPNLQLNVYGGVPGYYTILVDSTNFTAANWTACTSASITANLGSQEGWHELWVGLKGYPTNATVAWQWKRLKLDATPPTLIITGPTNATVTQPVIQLTGYSPEALGSYSYDLSNAVTFVTNQQVLVLDQSYSTNTFEFTTNTFQAFDIPLTNGVNAITLHAADLAGNVMTLVTNFTLDYSSKTNPPTVQITWPTNGTQLSGGSFTLDGQLDDPTASVSVSITDTNGDLNVVGGQVGRDGKFLADNIPLGAGTNTLTLAVTNAAGKGVITNICVLRSPLVLTINPLADSTQLWQPTVTLTGTISDSAYVVWANGIHATVSSTLNPDGITYNWSADNVPTVQGGVTRFNVTAYAPGEPQPGQ